MRNATIVPIALGERLGIGTLNLPVKRPGSYGFGLAHLGAVEARWSRVAAEPIAIGTIDEFVQSQRLERLDFIKADIEGWEAAMLRGGIVILDEGNRMSEKSWASLAPLLDNRRYVESIVAGIKIRAHPLFRVVATMNDDSSTFDLPEYIHSRLQPQILIDFPERHEELAILRENLPFGDEQILNYVTDFLQQAHAADGRCRQDRAAVVLVVERHVAGDDRKIERARGLANAADTADQLSHDLRPLGIAEIQIVGQR